MTGALYKWSELLRRIILGAFLLQCVIVAARLGPSPALLGADARWPEGLLLVLAAAATLAWLSRQLPAQQVMLASVVIVVLAGSIEALGALAGVPFGPIAYMPAFGPQLFYPLPWAAPFLWLVVILNARGVARLMLRRWRSRQDYGYWLLGVTALSVALFDFAMQPFAVEVKHYWRWQPTHVGLYWYAAPWVNFLGRAMTALLILAFATPVLINKLPIPRKPDWWPLEIWIATQLILFVGLVKHGLWPATAVVAVEMLALLAVSILSR